MYRIISDGATIATVDRLQFWKRQRNGVRINCEEREANGILVGDAFYHLPWQPHSGDGEPDVTYEEFSGAETLSAIEAALNE